jgi:hypothetical protein
MAGTIKMDIKAPECEKAEWIHLSEGPVVDISEFGMRLRVPQMADSFLTS